MRMRLTLKGLAGLMALAASSSEASEALLQKGGCLGCHAAEQKLVGPSLRDIAARYKADPAAPANLLLKLREGSEGSWGDIPMPALSPDKISDSELQSLLTWILARQ